QTISGAGWALRAVHTRTARGRRPIRRATRGGRPPPAPSFHVKHGHRPARGVPMGPLSVSSRTLHTTASAAAKEAPVDETLSVSRETAADHDDFLADDTPIARAARQALEVRNG